MSDTTPRSGLPLLAAAQAQKHVTHNEALIMLDALSCARILDRDLSTPPGSPSDGDAYLVKATGTDDWTGQDGRIAFCVDGGWRFYTPYQGLIIYVADEEQMFVYDGSSWADLASAMAFQNIPMLGVNTTADATNKLAVASSAVLFNHVGNGVQVKLNKNASGDTASFLYQDGFSGRAEIGLCGDDNFHFKVSPDGSSWTDALVIDRTSGLLTLADGVSISSGVAAAPNGSAAAPSFTFGSDPDTGFFSASSNNIGVTIGGSQIWTLSSTGLIQSIAGGAVSQINVLGEGTTQQNFSRYSEDSSSAVFTLAKGRGTIASRTVPALGDGLGVFQWSGWNGSSLTAAANIGANLIETGTVGSSAMGGSLKFRTCAIGSGSLTEVMRLEAGTGLSMYGANPVIDANRGIVLRSTTIAGAVTPSGAGKLFYHSDAQGGAGEVAVDTGSAYRYAGQPAVKRLTSDADATYTPRSDGRIVRDVATLTADRKLTLSTTNVTDRYKVEVSRRGSSGGFNRSVYQSDGTTLIASLADNASADFIYDATAGAWFQK